MQGAPGEPPEQGVRTWSCSGFDETPPALPQLTAPRGSQAVGLPASPQVDGDIPPRVKKDAHELILDFIRSRPPLKQVPAPHRSPCPHPPASHQEGSLEFLPREVSPGAQWTPVCPLMCGLLVVLPNSLVPTSPHPSYPALPHHPQVSERRLRPLPQKQRTLHEKILEEIKQERRLRPVAAERWGGRGEPGRPLPSHPSPLALSPPLTSCLAPPRVWLSALHPQRLLWGCHIHLLHQPVPDGGWELRPTPSAPGPAEGTHAGGDGGDEHVGGQIPRAPEETAGREEPEGRESEEGPSKPRCSLQLRRCPLLRASDSTLH